MPRFRRSSVPAVVLAALVLAACATAPPAASPTLEKAKPVSTPLPVRVWFHPVEILDTITKESARIAEAFTLSLHQYLSESQRFREVRLPPARPAPGDLAIQLLITRYRAERTEHGMSASPGGSAGTP